MKYLKLLIIASCMLFMVSCGDEEDPVNYITSAVVNSEGNLILTYSDGTIVDQGQVVPDVEVVEIPEEYVVNFYNVEGHIISSQMVEEGEDAFAPLLQLPDHLTFNDWDTDFTEVSMNLNVYPLYDEETFTIEFDDPYGVTPDMTGISYGETVTLPIPNHLPGFEFVGWYESESPYADMLQMDMLVLQDSMAYARYEDIHYSITYHVDGGTEVMTQEALYEEAVIMPVQPTKENYSFNGWYYDQEETMPVTFDFTITEDVEIYVSWIQFEVQLITNPYVLDGDGIGIFGSVNDHNVIHIPSEIDGLPVKIIYNNAFRESQASEVYLPDSLTEIHSYAFAEMPNLTSIVIPEALRMIGSKAFYNSTSLTNVTMNTEVHLIDGYAFENTAIESIVIPEGVVTISSGVFLNTPLSAVSIPSTVTTINPEAFRGTLLIDVIIPEGVTSIYENSFSDCPQLNSLSLPSTITYIGFTIVDNTPSLTEVTLHADNSAYEMVDDVLFTENLSVLVYYLPYKSDTSYHIPNTTQYLDHRAIYGNHHVQELEIPDDLSTSFLSSNFLYLSSILEYNVYDGSGTTVYASIDGVLYYYNYQFLFKYPVARTDTTYTVDSRVLYLYYSAFEGSTHLQSVILPDTLITMYDYTFKDCVNLQAINMPSSLNLIQIEAFYNVDGITSLTLPANMSYIGTRAFAEMDNLTSLTLNEGLTAIESQILLNTNNVTSIHIPTTTYSIRYDSFLGAKGLESITVAGGSPYYATYGSGLYDDTFAFFVAYPEAAMNNIIYVHPSTINVQPNFGENPYIEIIVLEPNVTNITAIIKNLPNLQQMVIERHSSSSIVNINPTDFGDPGQIIIYIPEGSFADYIATTDWDDYEKYLKTY